MTKRASEESLAAEILAHLEARKSLMIASQGLDTEPYASYAPFAYDASGFYVLLSDIAVHGKNLANHSVASVLVIEDEDSAEQLFARKRINFSVCATLISAEDSRWHQGIAALTERHGKRITQLSQLADFKLFHLRPTGGRYVKGFGQAYQIAGGTLNDISILHLNEGHKRKEKKSVA